MAKRKKKYTAGKKKFESVIATGVILAITAFVYFFAPDLFDGDSQRTGKVLMDGTMQVHFIDVGQGDSALIVTPDGKCILIDAGTNASEPALKFYLDSQNVSEIEYAVMTHPHEDHIGGADMIFDTYKVKNAILPDVTHDTVTFERMLTTIERNNTNLLTSKTGDVYTVGDVSFKILAPVNTKYSSLNDYSVVVRVDYGGTSFMFTGDAEKLSEKEMLAAHDKSEFSCDVLKVGHHGSTTSSSAEFIKAVNPSAAIISCGTGNSYGHPHRETIATLDGEGIEIYRTDLLGNIVFKADGADVTYIKPAA